MKVQKRFSRRGAYAAEFALMAPILLAMTSGIIDLGSYYQNQTELIQVVREGTRTGATFVDEFQTSACESATAMVKQSLQDKGYDVDSALFTANAAQDVVATGISAPINYFTVSVEMDYEPLFGFIPVPLEHRAELTMFMDDQSNTVLCS